ncbi:MAG: carboxyl transferase domain-containing protein [Myxococcota bacterium]|jgi:acetyl-CoA carboxylase carboxyltransferase component|nr:carboxyl transferase domain-containing protein [Myxococcota bacterium]
MSWKEEVDEIAKRRELAKQMGGEEAVAKQHERGRLTIRERIDGLVDRESFSEQGPLAGHSEVDEDGQLVSFTPGNYILGLAKIDGRPVAVGGEDFTQRGGSPTPAGLRKSVYAEELACRYRVPLVRFLEGGGGSVRGTGKQKAGPRPAGDPVFSRPRFESFAHVMATAPVVSAAMGAVAGFPAARLAASHLSIMTRETSQVLIAGPALVERAFGKLLTKDELGGARVHAKSGVVDCVADDEAHVFELMRQFLSYLPSNVWQLPPPETPSDDRNRCEESLLEIIPRDRKQVYKMRDLIRAVVDRDSVFEMSAGYGRSQITLLARLDGRSIGVIANDPYFYAGSMSAEGAQKVERFIKFCDTFHLPILSFVDEPGFMIGPDAEKAGTIRYGVDAIMAAVTSRVPWASVIVRKMYGVAAAAHFGPEGTVLTWPSAEAGALPIEGGVAVAFRREIAEAPDPEAKRLELEEAFARGRSPFPRAEAFGVHDLIDPRTTRPALCEWLDWVEPLQQELVATTPAPRR